jgi:steroid delta-isomerase-like uncharacterized protein
MSTTTDSTMTDTARAFFEACESGGGWEACSPYCASDATFSAQVEPLADVHTLEEYAEWMKGLFAIMPDARYELRSFATDSEHRNVCAYAVFSGTHSGAGGPVPPTGRSTSSDYVYVMDFADGRISHLTKIWNAGLAMKDLGWV